MNHPAAILSSPSTFMDNNYMDFGIYGIEQNDCYLDLNCIEPSLHPGSQQAYTYSTVPYSDTVTNINGTSSSHSTSNNVQMECTNQTIKRRTIRKKRPKKDPNEPQKPVSAYALFFRDTQAAIKGRSPNASFGEVSKIVASMWDSLDCSAKNLYKQRTEIAKKDYLKKLAAYRAQQISSSESVQCMSNERQMVLNSTNCATSSNNPAQQPPNKMGEMTLANLIARPPIDISKPISATADHQLIFNYRLLAFSFDAIPLIIELLGIICGIILCIFLHLTTRKSLMDNNAPTVHHLVHNKWYNMQLDTFLKEQENNNNNEMQPNQKLSDERSMQNSGRKKAQSTESTGG